jgi:predicted nucleotidyltransferase component of viral defense system
MPYESPAALRVALEARLRQEAAGRGVRPDRLRRRAVFERLLVRLDAAGPGAWVLKGGTALEVRWRERARGTRDLDLALREPPADGTALRELLIAQLADDIDGDRFSFQVGAPRPLAEDLAGRPGWRFPIRAMLAGREFAAVRVDVVLRSEELLATERLRLPGALAFAGFPDRDVEVVTPAQHFAEKLHALTRRYPDRDNTRVRDLVDLVLLIQDGALTSAEAWQVSRHVFAARATHELPAEIPDPPASWAPTYATLAGELGVQAGSLADAMERLRRFWADARASA